MVINWKEKAFKGHIHFFEKRAVGEQQLRQGRQHVDAERPY
jgi:hypothetical protein